MTKSEHYRAMAVRAEAYAPQLTVAVDRYRHLVMARVWRRIADDAEGDRRPFNAPGWWPPDR
jgi:hypothetical protein